MGASDTRHGKDAGIASLLKEDGISHAGMGIVVGPRQILTCAHVVNVALNRPPETTMRPRRKVFVDFPLAAQREPIGATVKEWRPMGPRRPADIALLELDTEAPEEVGIQIVAEVSLRIEADPLSVFGITAGRRIGNHVDARFMGHTTGNWVQIDSASSTGIFIEGGFSGAAVWDMVHEAVVGMVTARNPTNDGIAYMIPVADLKVAWPGLPHEVRRLPHAFGLAWTLGASAFVFALLYLLVVNRHPSPEQNPQLAAFWGMHVYGILAPLLGWVWHKHITDFRLHHWSDLVPRFLGLRAAPGSSAQKTIWALTVLFVVAVPLYAQGHFLHMFHSQGHVYIYPEDFGHSVEGLQGQGQICVPRPNPLCTHPEAGLYSTVTPKPPSSGKYIDNAYHYGEYSRPSGPTGNNSVTVFPILQPLAIWGLTLASLVLYARLFLRMFAHKWRRQGAQFGLTPERAD